MNTKALVIHNCATSAYVNGLKAFFPGWEVRGVVETLAEKWVASNSAKPEFIKYVQQAEVFIGPSLVKAKHDSLLSAQVKYIEIPPFWFRGLQPDCFHLDGFTSVLGPGGNLYSKILVSSFESGFTTSQAKSQFTEAVYEGMGYLDAFEREIPELIRRFDRFGINLSNSIERWLSRGSFLHSYNHPRIDVLIEILRRALVMHELLPKSELDVDRDLGVVDDLGESIKWPVYPEIASRLGLQGSLEWRMGREQKYKVLDLAEFVESTFRLLSARPLPQIPEAPKWTTALDPKLTR